MKTYLESKTVLQDRGEFTALAACYTVDRSGERIIPSAFSKTIARWRRASNKSVPLLWDHVASDPEYVIGTVDPASMEEVEHGLKVAGKIDQDSAKGRAAWRAIRSGSMSLSFGFMTVRSRTGADGVKELLELDLLEVSVVAGPANQDTRFIDLKSATADEVPVDDAPSADRVAFFHFAQRDPAEVVRESLARKRIEAEVERKSRPLQVASFDVE